MFLNFLLDREWVKRVAVCQRGMRKQALHNLWVRWSQSNCLHWYVLFSVCLLALVFCNTLSSKNKKNHNSVVLCRKYHKYGNKNEKGLSISGNILCLSGNIFCISENVLCISENMFFVSATLSGIETLKYPSFTGFVFFVFQKTVFVL